MVTELSIRIQHDLSRHKTRLRLYFQHNGASQRFVRHVMVYPNERFPDLWIGHGYPQNSPPWSPDLTLLNFSVWGYTKNNAL